MSSNNSISTSNYNQRARAAEFIQRGWSPFPVKFMGEEPIPADWQKLRIGVDDIDQWFPDEPTNIGVLLGKASGGLVDVHLVDNDALRLADDFLPRTWAKFGPASRRSSHRLYRLTGHSFTSCHPDEWVASGIGTLVELRGDNQYSVFPGSIVGGQTLFGKSGEPITFVDEQDSPAEIDREELMVDISMLAIATVLFKKWEHPNRRSLANGMARFLQGCALEQQFDAMWLVHSVAEAAGEDRSVISDHRTAIRTTFETPRKAGFSELARCLGEETARDIERWEQEVFAARDDMVACR